MRRLILLVFFTFLFASNTAYTTKKEIIKTKYYISKMNQKLDKLASEINKKENYLKILNQQILNLNKQINILQNQLKDSNKKLSELTDLKKGYENKAQKIQNEITDFISENYLINSIKSENLNDLINKEISQKILEKYSQKINSLSSQNKKILKQIKNVNDTINLILQKQNELKIKKQKLSLLLKKQRKELMLLNSQKIKYKSKLQSLIKKQKELQNRLIKLKIIKQRKINVKRIGNSYFKPQIANYKGPKTIAPIQGKIIKKFGSYIDPIYKIKVYNDSITIKPYRPNSVVRSILSGRVVYIGENNDKKIIVIKHKNNLFSIYANLDKVSPLLKKGSYVKRGQIIARVKDALEFEVTYKEKPINPIKIILLK